MMKDWRMPGSGLSLKLSRDLRSVDIQVNVKKARYQLGTKSVDPNMSRDWHEVKDCALGIASSTPELL